jgi:tetratricopeptide (TPR) repeat protein
MTTLSFVAWTALVPLLAVAAPSPSTSKATHRTAAAPAAAVSDSLGERLGTIDFAVTGTPAAQAQVVRGVKLLHHMMYLEADRVFARAAAEDPQCALAYWGRAMTIIHPLWTDVPTAAELKQGWDFVEAGLAVPPATPRERAYLETLAAYFSDAASHDHRARLEALDEGWERVAQTYPDDLDAAAFSALFRLAPARFLPKEQAHRLQLAAGNILQGVLTRLPDHPGGQHYKIHAYDSPLLADRALELCDSYGNIAPDVPHALHMPTHIFTRRGQWDKSIEFNLRSADAAKKLIESSGSVNLHYPHALDYLAYAYLQRGQYQEADTVRRQVLTLTGPYHPSNRSGMAFAFAAIPARYALERHDWSAAAQVEPRQPASFPWEDAYPHCDSIIAFARGLGAVRTGKMDAARSELRQLEQLERRLAAAQPQSYWASQARTQRLTLQSWLALHEGRTEAAVTLMRQAAALEGSTEKEAVTPGEVLPAGELLGDMLMEIGRAGEARLAYEGVLETSPNRLNSLFGAARGAELHGDADAAATHYRTLLAVANAADPGLETLRHAQAFLSRQSR